MHPSPPSSFQSSQSSLLHCRRYYNQNITCNWAISPNLGGKIQSCLFCLKCGTHGILLVLILNLHLDSWNSDPKIHFWANLGQESQSCLFCLRNWHTSYLKDADSYFNIGFLSFQPYIHFWANLGLKSQSCPFCLNTGPHSISRMMILIPISLVFRISNPKSIFG